MAIVFGVGRLFVVVYSCLYSFMWEHQIPNYFIAQVLTEWYLMLSSQQLFLATQTTWCEAHNYLKRYVYLVLTSSSSSCTGSILCVCRGPSLAEVYQQQMAAEGKHLKGGKLSSTSASGLDLGELMGSRGSKPVTAHDLNGMVADAKALDSRFSRQVTRQFM